MTMASDWTLALSWHRGPRAAQSGAELPASSIGLDELPSHMPAARRQVAALEAKVAARLCFHLLGPRVRTLSQFSRDGCSNLWVTHLDADGLPQPVSQGVGR